MKQLIQFKMSLPDSSYDLCLRKVYEEDDRLVVILEIEQEGGGFCAIQDMSLNLVIDLAKSVQKLPVTYFVVQDIQEEIESIRKHQPDWSPWWLKTVNHVQSDKSITISNRATCLYDGKLMIPSQFGEGHYGYEISNGCATKSTVRIENTTTQARASDIGVFATSPVIAANTNNSTSSAASRKYIIM